MATNVWKGGAALVAQVDTVTPGGTIAANDIFTITINGKSVSVTATTTTVAHVTALMTAAFNASEEPEFSEITASDGTTHVTLTSDTAGVPFTCAATTSPAVDETFTLLSDGTGASVLNSGPNDAAVVTNWSDGSLPAADDNVVFENSAVSCLYNLDVTDALTLTSKSTFTGHIGLPRNNAHGYVEYRATAFNIGTAVTAITIGQGDGAGSGRINLDVGALTAALAITVYKTASRVATDVPSVLLTTGTQSNDTTLIVNRGDVGVAVNYGETAVIDALTMGYISQASSDAKVTLGSGVTPLTTVTKSGGVLVCSSNIITLTNTAGTTTIEGTATLTTGTISGGTLYYNSSETATTLNVAGDATLDFRQDARARIVSNALLYQKGTILDPAKTVTWSAGIDVIQCGLADVTLDVGEHVTITPSVIGA